jgi:hypothetical protein
VRGRDFLDQLPAQLAGQRRLLTALLDRTERWDAARWLIVGASVARGNADVYSDLDLGLGVDDAALPDALDEATRIVAGCGELVDLLEHGWPAVQGPHRHVFAQYADGTQVDLITMPASATSGLVLERVILYDRDGALARQERPQAYVLDGERIREWAFLGWWALGDLVKYVRRGSAWEARERLGTARRHMFQLWAAAHGVPDATFGLTALLDAPAVGLPPDVERTAAALDDKEIVRAARALAELLEAAARRAAETTPTELPDALSAYVRQRLTAL